MRLFDPGAITVSPEAAAALAHSGESPAALLQRYQRGEWGESEVARRRRNDFAVRHGRVVYSVYSLRDGTRILVITSADRSATRVLLPDEFQSVELSVRDGYAVWAKSYDLENNPLIAVEDPLVDRLLAGLDFRSALDAGTGTGRLALKMARRGAAVTALDQSPEMMRGGRAAAAREGLDIQFVLGSIEAGLPFAAARFDLLTCALVLCHVSELSAVMEEFHRVVRPGGHLLITDFHPDAVAYGWRTACWDGCTTYRLPNPSHVRDDYLQAAERAGFDVLTALDIPVREIPTGYETDDFIDEHGDLNLCLVLLARKTANR